jgi:hypothetical protein
VITVPAVSQALRKHGLVTVPRYRREGISISRPEPGLGVRVVIDYDTHTSATEAALKVEEALRAEGLHINYGPDPDRRGWVDKGFYAFYVTR